MLLRNTPIIVHIYTINYKLDNIIKLLEIIYDKYNFYYNYLL